MQQIGMRWIQHILICMLVLVIVWTDYGTRLEAATQVLFCYTIDRKAAVPEEDMQIVPQGTGLCQNKCLIRSRGELEEHTDIKAKIWSMAASMKHSWLALACILILLQILSRQKSHRIHIYDTWYIRHRYYHIIYMQDLDGRKKIPC